MRAIQGLVGWWEYGSIVFCNICVVELLGTVLTGVVMMRLGWMVAWLDGALLSGLESKIGGFYLRVRELVWDDGGNR